MSILVLGGAGYIGSHTVYELVERGRDVVVVDNLSTGHAEAVHPGARFYRGDVRDRGFMDGVFASEGIDAVIHFAACSQVGESMVDPLKYYDNNLYGAMVLLESMLAAGVGRIVFSSTAACYGEPRRIPICEEDPAEPSNTYGETKLAMERMFGWVALAKGLRYVSLRYFNACGARPGGVIGEDHDPESHLLPLVLQVAAGRRERMQVFGDDYPTRDGTCVRDYVHVDDLADAHISAVDYLSGGGESEVFNLGNGVGFTVMEVIEAARRVTGCVIPVVVGPRRAGDPAQLVASNGKARVGLGFSPRYTGIEDIIATAWEWHVSHPGGFAVCC